MARCALWLMAGEDVLEQSSQSIFERMDFLGKQFSFPLDVLQVLLGDVAMSFCQEKTGDNLESRTDSNVQEMRKISFGPSPRTLCDIERNRIRRSSCLGSQIELLFSRKLFRDRVYFCREIHSQMKNCQLFKAKRHTAFLPSLLRHQSYATSHWPFAIERAKRASHKL